MCSITWSISRGSQEPHLSLYNLYGASMTIKGSLHVSIPIVKRFRPKNFKVHFLTKIWPLGHTKGLNINCKYFNPKRHFLAWKHVFWAISCQNPLRGLTCRWVSEKNVYINKKSQKCYISPICAEAPRERICTKFGIGRSLPDIITCANFYIKNRFRGFDSLGGRNLPFSID